MLFPHSKGPRSRVFDGCSRRIRNFRCFPGNGNVLLQSNNSNLDGGAIEATTTIRLHAMRHQGVCTSLASALLVHPECLKEPRETMSQGSYVLVFPAVNDPYFRCSRLMVSIRTLTRKHLISNCQSRRGSDARNSTHIVMSRVLRCALCSRQCRTRHIRCVIWVRRDVLSARGRNAIARATARKQTLLRGRASQVSEAWFRRLVKFATEREFRHSQETEGATVSLIQFLRAVESRRRR